MAYYAVYNVETGEIENMVECPEFLKETIHVDEAQSILEVDTMIQAASYIVKNQKLTIKD
ncbi:hypothetical protein [Acinetobacter radioresistens]|uniref:hypothetical protein n=1 Tax=Acinetobacter radioresistens TaxID=40216 RepID=UPI002003424A|nr:hypothetical protein [Acinetobacter radioresistens]MCK4095389.1 hypothetical protein [Acinetobacter radioresistens]